MDEMGHYINKSSLINLSKQISLWIKSSWLKVNLG